MPGKTQRTASTVGLSRIVAKTMLTRRSRHLFVSQERSYSCITYRPVFSSRISVSSAWS